MTSVRSALALASILLAPCLPAQILYEEGFDSEASAAVSVGATSDTVTTFVDYSNFTIGATVHSIPEAPNMIPGSAATRGVVMQANLSEGALNVVNLTALETAGGDEVELAAGENFRVSFDMYLSVADPLPGTGSTESVVWGVGHDGLIRFGRLNRDDPGLVGSWGWLSTEGGFGTEDAILFNGPVELADLGNTTDGSAMFLSAFPAASPVPQAPNNSWVHAEITVLNGQLTVEYNGVEFFRTTDVKTDGFVVIGYEDPFGSISSVPDFQFGLFDNFVIETAFAPNIAISQLIPFAPVSEEGGMATGTFLIENLSDDVLTVDAINISGADGGAFTIAGMLPITIPANSLEMVDVDFTAAGAFGTKAATIEFVTTDAMEPSISLPLRALFAAPLLAHYKLDEESGTTVVDASQNGADGLFNVSDPLVYGAEALATGTSIGFTAAQFPPAGNFGILPPLHTPTTSLSVWIRPESGDGGTDTLFNRDPQFSAGDNIYGLFIDDSGAVTFRVAGQTVLTTDPGLILDGSVYHIVLTHLDEDGFGNATATRSRLYIDGELIVENDATVGFDDYPPGASTTSLYLATRAAAGFGFDGLMDDVQVYSVEIDAAQVATMFAAPGSTALERIADFRITSIDYDQSLGIVRLVWNSLPRKFYILEASSTLEEWFEVVDSIESGGFTTQYEIENPDPAPAFYRIIEE